MSPANNILTDIRSTREELARRFHSDIPALLAHLRKAEPAAEPAGREVGPLVNLRSKWPEPFRVKEE